MVRKRKKFTLMPAIALLGLSALVSVPMLSSAHLYAASPEHSTTVTVHPGDTLWTLAERHVSASANVQDTVDAIAAANHLKNAVIVPGQQLKIPQ